MKKLIPVNNIANQSGVLYGYMNKYFYDYNFVPDFMDDNYFQIPHQSIGMKHYSSPILPSAHIYIAMTTTNDIDHC